MQAERVRDEGKLRDKSGERDSDRRGHPRTVMAAPHASAERAALGNHERERDEPDNWRRRKRREERRKQRAQRLQRRPAGRERPIPDAAPGSGSPAASA